MEYHPKFVERWGKNYVDRYLKNPQEAINWALGFFPGDAVPLVIDEAKKELKKRGIKLK